MSTETIPAVLRTVEVSIAPEGAFDMFTRRMGEWWPFLSHSIAEERAVGVRFEEWYGGKVLELVDDGTEWEWAEVMAWEPPHRLVLAWHPTPEPTVSTEVEVRFSAIDGGTRVELEHRGWERLGEVAMTARVDYDQGWLPVLSLYQAAANG
ncbi:MAG TPA: SRPBCC domain-containing protein [Acidimicrobiia bacterium]|nr:SRPBCC domain-containing protein [Acidimicrobiia bacterium]